MMDHTRAGGRGRAAAATTTCETVLRPVCSNCKDSMQSAHLKSVANLGDIGNDIPKGVAENEVAQEELAARHDCDAGWIANALEVLCGRHAFLANR